MTHRLFAFILLFISFIGAGAQTSDRFFPYPTIPAELTKLQDRSDYLLTHFWDACNFQAAFTATNKPQLAKAFSDYASFIPLGSRDAALSSIDKLLKRLEKQPAQLVYMAELAENNFYGDSAEVLSDEVFLPFAKAVSSHKKTDKASRLRFAEKVRIIEGNREGSPVPDIKYTTIDGRNSSFAADTAKLTIIYFNDPYCDDCRMARTRLDVNLTANRLIDRGLLKIIAVTPEESTPEWREAVSSYPSKWDVTAIPDAYDRLDIRHFPSFYVLDNEHNILYKNLDVETIMKLLSTI